jgi:hypothetical protein
MFGGFDSTFDSRGGVGGLAVVSVLDIGADCTIMAARTVTSTSIHRGDGECSITPSPFFIRVPGRGVEVMKFCKMQVVACCM